MATYFFRNNGLNWGDATNWSTTDGGGSAGVVPTTLDDTIFTSNSGSCSVNTIARNCRSLTFTTFAQTITFVTTLNVVGGNITLGTASMTMVQGAAVPAINLNASGVSAITFSTSGCICAVSLRIFKSPGGALAITMGSNWTQRGNLTFSNAGSVTTFLGNTITFDRTCTIDHSTRVGGTTLFLWAPIVGNTITQIGAAQFGMPLTINGAGSIVMGNFTYGESLFTYTAGTVTHTGTLTMAASGSYNTAGIVFLNGQTTALGASTHTLISNLTFSGSFAVPGSSPTINGPGLKIIVGANLTITGQLLGTASIMMNGTGVLSGPATNATLNTIEINTGGTVTLSGAIAWLRTLLFNGGTVISTGSTVTCSSLTNFTLNAVGFNLNNYVHTSTTNFLGSHGCDISSYTSTTAGSVNTFASTETYNITTGLNLLGTVASPVIFKSSTPGVQANVNLTLGSAMAVAYVDADDINSAGGQTIWNYDGTLTNTVNWALLQNPVTVGFPWVR